MPATNGQAPLADDPKLMNRIAQDYAALGLVGEKEAAQLLYAVATSRLLADTLHAIVKGHTSSGKSKLVETTAELMPSKQVVVITSMSALAIYKLPSLKNKFVVKGERKHKLDDDAKDATAAFRQLQSEKYICREVANKGGGTTCYEQFGPISSCETTTCKTIFDEDLNRCLLITTDDSEEQTERVVKAAGTKYNRAAAREDVINRHREFQQSLEPKSVVVPYSSAIADNVPTGRIEARRAIHHILSTIEAIALLHQFQRSVDEDGRLIATREDYEIARSLLIGPLSQSLSLSRNTQAAYDAMLKLAVKSTTTFTPAEIEAKAAISNTARKRAINELAGLGVIECVEESAGQKPARWRLTNLTIEAGAVSMLPTVEAVFAGQRARAGQTPTAHKKPVKKHAKRFAGQRASP